MKHEAIAQHLRLAEIAGIKVRLQDERGGAGLYIDNIEDVNQRWAPFDRIEQAYNVLARFCDRHDSGADLIEWTLDRKAEGGCPQYNMHIEVRWHASESTYVDATTSPSAAICLAILEADQKISSQPVQPVAEAT